MDPRFASPRMTKEGSPPLAGQVVGQHGGGDAGGGGGERAAHRAEQRPRRIGVTGDEARLPGIEGRPRRGDVGRDAGHGERCRAGVGVGDGGGMDGGDAARALGAVGIAKSLEEVDEACAVRRRDQPTGQIGLDDADQDAGEAAAMRRAELFERRHAVLV